MGYFWGEDVVNQRLQDKMVASFNDLCRYADSRSVDTRTAAYMLAIDRRRIRHANERDLCVTGKKHIAKSG